jgi:hypothetical protein
MRRSRRDGRDCGGGSGLLVATANGLRRPPPNPSANRVVATIPEVGRAGVAGGLRRGGEEYGGRAGGLRRGGEKSGGRAGAGAVYTQRLIVSREKSTHLT